MDFLRYESFRISWYRVCIQHFNFSFTDHCKRIFSFFFHGKLQQFDPNFDLLVCIVVVIIKSDEGYPYFFQEFQTLHEPLSVHKLHIFLA